MNTWLTTIHVRPGQTGAFIDISEPFAAACLAEKGLVSFALLQQLQNETCFSLFEVYHDQPAREAHLQSAHYRTWRLALATLLAGEPQILAHAPIFPPPEDWERHLEA